MRLWRSFEVRRAEARPTAGFKRPRIPVRGFLFVQLWVDVVWLGGGLRFSEVERVIS